MPHYLWGGELTDQQGCHLKSLRTRLLEEEEFATNNTIFFSAVENSVVADGRDHPCYVGFSQPDNTEASIQHIFVGRQWRWPCREGIHQTCGRGHRHHP